jgi:hypothetical protein
MAEIVIRFLVGGLVVTSFSTLADVLRPKSFAGLPGAAPSVALATLGLTIHHDGRAYAALEGRSMIAGAIAFFVYALTVSWLLRRYRPSATLAASSVIPVWFVVSFGLWRWLASIR